MKSQRASISVLAALASASLIVAGCSSGGDTNADDQERTLTVYSGRDEELVQPLIDLFEKDSGITVDVRYAGTTEMAAQLLEEGEATPAQVFLSQDAGALGALGEADLFAPLPAELTEQVDAGYTSTDGSWVGLTGRARVIAYDSETYDEADIPADVLELTDSEWEGKVGIAPTNASFQAFVTALRVNDGEDVAEKWLEDLVANDAQIFESNGAILEAVNTGAVDLGLINHYYWAGAEGDPTEQRAQLKFGEPGSTSALVNVSGAGILAGAAESAEAAEFVEYLLSEKAQTYFLEETHEYPLVAGLPGPENLPALADLGGPDIDLSSLSSLEETVELITSVGLL